MPQSRRDRLPHCGRNDRRARGEKAKLAKICSSRNKVTSRTTRAIVFAVSSQARYDASERRLRTSLWSIMKPSASHKAVGMQLEAAHIVRTCRIWRALQKSGKARAARNRAALCALVKFARLHVLDHALTQRTHVGCCHGKLSWLRSMTSSIRQDECAAGYRQVRVETPAAANYRIAI
jgi:hypothetical protein